MEPEIATQAPTIKAHNTTHSRRFCHSTPWAWLSIRRPWVDWASVRSVITEYCTHWPIPRPKTTVTSHFAQSCLITRTSRFCFVAEAQWHRSMPAQHCQCRAWYRLIIFDRAHLRGRLKPNNKLLSNAPTKQATTKTTGESMTPSKGVVNNIPATTLAPLDNPRYSGRPMGFATTLATTHWRHTNRPQQCLPSTAQATPTADTHAR